MQLKYKIRLRLITQYQSSTLREFYIIDSTVLLGFKRGLWKLISLLSHHPLTSPGMQQTERYFGPRWFFQRCHIFAPFFYRNYSPRIAAACEHCVHQESSFTPVAIHIGIDIKRIKYGCLSYLSCHGTCAAI